MWSPKRNSNGARNHFYDSMREVAPGDIIFSFNNTFIPSIGVAQSNCYECPKPDEFGTTGRNWDRIGWKVNVKYHALQNVIRPRDHMEVIRPLLPNKYSPLQQSGAGLQGVYLTELDPELAGALSSLIGHEAKVLALGYQSDDVRGNLSADTSGLLEWEEHLRHEVESDETIPETEKETIILSRIGQGKFKENVRQIELRCRITKVDKIEHLRASHLKPWRDSDNTERLDGENGLLLTPSIDHLLDRGFISFENNGDLLISPVSHKPSLERMGVEVNSKLNVGGFTQGQKAFLEFHREEIFLQKRI
jgi:putative restriction endonuclease